ncbi:hypothetical protein [Flavivirga algicola]|uniref:Uncharacterized protein n=1 Tax=Flavivirga algicola TaxID=2729136 RepID=A0ABX1S146_9FLAO|nr:hypothetical protein [Flavivirga algicola]NMH88285.1 hypothetical protein [Flavivirga algicola]
MNLQKTILSLLFFVITSSAVFAQSDVDAKVNDLIQQDNVMLTGKDKSLKLSKTQEAQAKELYKALVLFQAETSKSKKKKDTYKKELRAKRGETLDAIKSLLTSKQLAAYDAYGAK